MVTYTITNDLGPLLVGGHEEEEGQGGGEQFTPHGHPHHMEVRGLLF